MQTGWNSPRRWVRTGRWLLVPYAVIAWVRVLPFPVEQVAFVIGVIGLAGIGAAVVVALLRRGRGLTALLGAVLFLGGLALFGLDPLPGSIPGLGDWWPDAITQPQTVGSGYWTLAALGVTLTGAGALVTLLMLALLGGPRTHAPRR